MKFDDGQVSEREANEERFKPKLLKRRGRNITMPMHVQVHLAYASRGERLAGDACSLVISACI